MTAPGSVLGGILSASLLAAAVSVGAHRATPHETAVADSIVNGESYVYLGTKRCRMCHVDQYGSWRSGPKARSWDALKPGVAARVKDAAGLDRNEDYTTDTRCLRCHSVGFGEPGGYVIPDPADGESVRLAATREGVGCEACHGPGSGFVPIMQDIYRTDRKYRPQELYAAGRRLVGPEVCAKCHNKDAICMIHGSDTDSIHRALSRVHVNVADRRGYHAKFPLEHREPAKLVNAAGQTKKPNEAE